MGSKADSLSSLCKLLSDSTLVFVQRVTAEKLNITEEAMSQKLGELQRLLPNLLQKMTVMGPDLLAQLSADPSQLAGKLLQLKIIFPEADTSRMVSNQISMS